MRLLYPGLKTSVAILAVALVAEALPWGGLAQAQVIAQPRECHYSNPIFQMQCEQGVTPGSETAEQFTKRSAQRQLEQQREADAWWAGMLSKILAPASPSPWLEKERKLFMDAVVMAKPTVLVVPPMAPADAAGIDISSRITIGRQIARAIEADVGEIPDPALVYRALGEPRSVSVDEIRGRFSGTSAQWLIVGTARQDGAGKMRVTLSKLPMLGNAETPTPFDKAGIDIGDDRPPELQFAGLAADAARALGYSGARSSAAKATKSAELALPKTPVEFSAEQETLGGLWMQQLMGVLHTPPHLLALPRPRERVFERTLAALIDIPREAPDRTVLLARALVYLDRRQAALKVLAEGTGTPEEKALAAYLNSDLPGLTAAVAQLKRPAAKLVSQLELVALRKGFGTLAQGDLAGEVKTLTASLPEEWRAPIAFYVMGLDLWTLPSAASVKLVLDRVFPVAGYGAENLVRGKATLGTGSYDEKTGVVLALSPLVHAQKWRAEHLQELCCRTGAVTWGEYRRDQYLDLLENDADNFAMARLNFLTQIQGMPDQAMRLANLYDDVLFAGAHPGVVHERLLAAFSLFDRAALDQRPRIGSEAFENARKLLAWETAQSAPLSAAWAAHNGYFQYFVQSQDPRPRPMKSLPPLNLEQDVPMRSLWAQRLGDSNMRRDDVAVAAARSACDNSILIFQPCFDYVDKLKSVGPKAALDGAIETLIEPRFKGNAWRYAMLALRKEESGDFDAAQALLVEAVRMPNAPASAYASLGRSLREQGKFADAAKAYLSYPGLKTAKENVVAMSNYAGVAGMGLARRGALKEGRPLLELAAANRDGSASSLNSAAQLSLSAGDFPNSLATLRQAYQRYSEPGTAAAIASILFMLGQPENAWSALSDVLPEAKGFAPYRAAAVGLRAGAYDDDAKLNWRIDTLRRSNASGAARDWIVNDLTVTVLFQTAAMDRDIASLNSIFDIQNGYTQMRVPAPRPGAQSAAEQTSVSQPVMLFMNSYIAFRKGDHKSAAEAWNKLVKEYDGNATPSAVGSEYDTFWSGMPYLALSLAKTGRLAEAGQLPERLTPEGRPAGSPKAFPSAAAWRMPTFDRKMIAGIVAAFSGNHAEAQQLFRGAQGAMAASGGRMIPPEYAFVELLETVSKETGVAAYKDLALAFARGYQEYSPWAAWAYAFDAEYSPRGRRQIRSIALALKLDPKSARIAKLDPKLVNQARAWLRTNDPFVEKKRPARETTS